MFSFNIRTRNVTLHRDRWSRLEFNDIVDYN